MRVRLDINENMVSVADSVEYLNEGEMIAAAVGLYGQFEQVRLADFLHFLNKDYSWFVDDLNNVTIAQYYWLLGLRQYTEVFIKALDKMTIPMTDRERKHSNGCIDNTFEQGVLLFCRDYFGLPSFDIGDLRVWEFMLAKQNSYNREVFQRNETAEFKRKGVKR